MVCYWELASERRHHVLQEGEGEGEGGKGKDKAVVKLEVSVSVVVGIFTDETLSVWNKMTREKLYSVSLVSPSICTTTHPVSWSVVALCIWGWNRACM